MTNYIAYLHKDSDSDFGVSFPDFPGCVTVGKTLEEAHKLAAEALEFHVEGMIEDGEALPEPSTLDKLAADPDMDGAIAFLVPLVIAADDKTVRFNVTARESQLSQIDAAAEEEGMSRSAFIIQASLRAAPAGLALTHDGSQSKRVKLSGVIARDARTGQIYPAGSATVGRKKPSGKSGKSGRDAR